MYWKINFCIVEIISVLDIKFCTVEIISVLGNHILYFRNNLCTGKQISVL